MIEVLRSVNLLLEQTAHEKRLTVVYIGIFLGFVAFLLIDMYAMKKWASNKIINKIVLVFLIVAMIAFAVAYFVVSKN